jgi:hypothetical protein
MNTLISSTGLSARIHTLPGREPFMTATDLAEFYQTSPKRLAEQVKRNPDRFPEDFCFRLSEHETAMWSQNATTSQGERADLRPLVFTHAGALMLSAVLKTDIAARISVEIHRAFAAMEQAAFDQMNFTVSKLRSEAMRRSGLRTQVINGVRARYGFEAIWRMGAASRPRLSQAARECLALGLIEALPRGTPAIQADLFALEV